MSKDITKNAKALATIKKNLDIIDQKQDEYAQRYNDDRFKKACHAIQAIRVPIENMYERLETDKNYSVADFKKDTTTFIKSQTFKDNFNIVNELRKPQIMAAIVNILFAISTLIIGLVIKKCITDSFFFRLNTDGANKVDALTHTIANTPN